MSKDSMTYVVLFIRCSLGDPLYGERNFVKHGSFIGRERKAWRASPLKFFGQFDGNEVEEYLKMGKDYQKLNLSFLYNL